MSASLPTKPSIRRPNVQPQHAAVASPSRHPRRPQAHASVSLRHSALEPHRKQRPLESIPRPRVSPSDRSSLINHKSSSGESSNAERWFETSNNNVSGNAAEFVDNDPPFYHHDSSNESPSHAHRQDSDNSGQYLPYSSHPKAPIFSPGSSTEEYRSVIDDLTIENQKLKQKLKSLSKSNGSPMDADRLFEVRVHGLPPAKKRELDEILQQFALGLEVSPNAGPRGVGVDSMVSQLPAKPSFSHLSKFGDSGYGSAATPGRTPTAGSGSSGTSQHKKVMPVQDASARNQTIRSYLHDIPAGLLPRHAKAMSEKARKKLVIRRLEQIFAGRGAANEGHQLPIQQQEVSHSAARDDRSAIEARGQRANKEGIREAPIMDKENEDILDMSKDDFKTGSPEGAMDDPSSSTQTVEQRPTRPLDLDPHRAQIPAENMQYFRHLGFEVGDVSEMTNGDNWIYLNLLINMAQLHTINVTSEFVKQAVAEYSTKLELSSDGRKVRWKGSRRLTHDSSPSSGAGLSNESSVDTIEEETTTSRKRVKLSHGRSVKSDPSHLYRNAPMSQATSQIEDKLAYTPLFRHKQFVDNAEDTSESGSHSSSSSVLDDDALENVYSPHDSAPHKKKDDGLMVFYSKAKFCTDLSGDSRISPRSAENDTDYITYTAAAVGAAARPGTTRRMFSSIKESPLYTTKLASGTVASTESEAEVSLDGLSASSVSSKRVQFAEPTEMEFEVSGLGGVRPADNLSITVVRQNERAGSPATKARNAAISTRLANVLPRKEPTAGQSTIERIVSSHSRTLPPSELPVPSYVMAVEESDSDSDSVESNSMDAYNGSCPTLSTAPQPLALISPNTSVTSDDEDESEFSGDEDDVDDNGSVDLLAAARAFDPATVRAREREYDANMAERLAEEIPAGSSAATAGGGSGFSSPGLVTGIPGAMDVSDGGVGEDDSDEGLGDDASISS